MRVAPALRLDCTWNGVEGRWQGMGGAGLPKRILLIWISRDLYAKFYAKKGSEDDDDEDDENEKRWGHGRRRDSRLRLRVDRAQGDGAGDSGLGTFLAVGSQYFYLCWRCQSCLPKGLSCLRCVAYFKHDTCTVQHTLAWLRWLPWLYPSVEAWQLKRRWELGKVVCVAT